MPRVLDEDTAHTLLFDDIYDENDQLVYSAVERSKWTQRGGHQTMTVIFQVRDDPNFYRLEAYRTGSDYSEWTYEYPSMECPTVEKVTKITHEWKRKYIR